MPKIYNTMEKSNIKCKIPYIGWALVYEAMVSVITPGGS